MSQNKCTIAGCERLQEARGWCPKHYKRWYANGSPHRPERGYSKSVEYRAWTAMQTRCLNTNNPSYKHYGERGITVCDRWLKGEDGKRGYECFLADMGPRPSDKHEVDRRDNNKGYSPENCHWATKKVQANNKRSNHVVTFDGRTMTLKQWCDLLGVPRRIVSQRIRRDGWTFVEAVTTSHKDAKILAAKKRWITRKQQTV